MHIIYITYYDIIYCIYCLCYILVIYWLYDVGDVSVGRYLIHHDDSYIMIALMMPWCKPRYSTCRWLCSSRRRFIWCTTS